MHGTEYCTLSQKMLVNVIEFKKVIYQCNIQWNLCCVNVVHMMTDLKVEDVILKYCL